MELKKRIVNKVNEKESSSLCPFPKKNLLIEVTNHCNNKCIFCYNDCMKRKKTFIKKEMCERVLKEAYFLGMREVGFYVVGEPLLDKRLKDFIRLAKKIGYNYVYITTNGILANLSTVKELYKNGLDSIKYSINATNPEDYKMIHKTNSFSVVIKNLEDVYRWKKRYKRNLKVYVSYISTDQTKKKEEIDNLFKDKCDEYVVMPAINQGGLIPDMKKISTREETDINDFKLPCPYPFHSVVVTVEGYVTACCMDFENLLAYANLNECSLEEAWNNTTIQAFRKKQLEGNVEHTVCHNCIYGGKSKPSPLDKTLCHLKEDDKLFIKNY